MPNQYRNGTLSLLVLALSIVFTIFAVTGCGGHAHVGPVPPVVNMAGTWTGQFTSTPTKTDPAVHTGTFTFNFSQGSATTNSSGLQAATLTAAVLVQAKDCPAVTQGTSTAGAVTGSNFDVTLHLNDGGQLHLTGTQGDSGTITVNTGFTFDSGTCAPEAGVAPLAKK